MDDLSALEGTRVDIISGFGFLKAHAQTQLLDNFGLNMKKFILFV